MIELSFNIDDHLKLAHNPIDLDLVQLYTIVRHK
jgi:hypothetical protein